MLVVRKFKLTPNAFSGHLPHYFRCIPLRLPHQRTRSCQSPVRYFSFVWYRYERHVRKCRRSHLDMGFLAFRRTQLPNWQRTQLGNIVNNPAAVYCPLPLANRRQQTTSETRCRCRARRSHHPRDRRSRLEAPRSQVEDVNAGIWKCPPSPYEWLCGFTYLSSFGIAASW